jgi:hypothetical protein
MPAAGCSVKLRLSQDSLFSPLDPPFLLRRIFDLGGEQGIGGHPQTLGKGALPLCTPWMGGMGEAKLARDAQTPPHLRQGLVPPPSSVIPAEAGIQQRLSLAAQPGRVGYAHRLPSGIEHACLDNPPVPLMGSGGYPASLAGHATSRYGNLMFDLAKTSPFVPNNQRLNEHQRRQISPTRLIPALILTKPLYLDLFSSGCSGTLVGSGTGKG